MDLPLKRKQLSVSTTHFSAVSPLAMQLGISTNYNQNRLWICKACQSPKLQTYISARWVAINASFEEGRLICKYFNQEFKSHNIQSWSFSLDQMTTCIYHQTPNPASDQRIFIPVLCQCSTLWPCPWPPQCPLLQAAFAGLLLHIQVISSSSYWSVNGSSPQAAIVGC